MSCLSAGRVVVGITTDQLNTFWCPQQPPVTILKPHLQHIDTHRCADHGLTTHEWVCGCTGHWRCFAMLWHSVCAFTPALAQLASGSWCQRFASALLQSLTKGRGLTWHWMLARAVPTESAVGIAMWLLLQACHRKVYACMILLCNPQMLCCK